MILNPTTHLFTEVIGTGDIDITIDRTTVGESWCHGLPKAALISIFRDIFNLDLYQKAVRSRLTNEHPRIYASFIRYLSPFLTVVLFLMD